MPKRPTSKTATIEVPEFLKPFVPEKLDYVPRVISPGMTDEDFFDYAWRSNQFPGYCAANGSFMQDKNKPCGVDLHEGKCAFVRHAKMNIALTGPTGTGKTSGLVNFAARHQLPMFTVTASTSAHAAFGQYVPDPDTGGLRWVKGPAWMIAQYGGVLYFDEINFLEPGVQSVFFGLTDFRRTMVLNEHPIVAVCDTHGMLETLTDSITGVDHRHCPGIRRWQGPLSIPLNPMTLVVATYNPVGQYAGTNQLNAALSNRFVTLHYGYDTAVESELLNCSSIAALGEGLRLASDTIKTPVSTNRLIEFERLIQETNDYSLAKTIFLGNFASHEQPHVRRILEDAYEDTDDLPDGGIFKAFGFTTDESGEVIYGDTEDD